MHRFIHHRFSVTELMVAGGLLVLVLASAMPFMLSSARIDASASLQGQLEMQKFITLERMKRDIVSTSRARILTAPRDGGPLRALSFPILRRAPDITTSPMAADGSIAWTETVIYHLFSDRSGTSLRRTAFSPYDPSLTLDQRLAQLDGVLAAGSGAAWAYGANTATQTMLANVQDYEIRIDQSEIDGYAATPTRQSLSLGSFVLSPGSHTFQFKVSGKNSSSTGYGIDIDSLTPGPAGASLDTENLLPPSAYSGAYPQVIDMSAAGGWDNCALLRFAATGTNQFFSLPIYNDSWLVSSFAEGTAAMYRSQVVFDAGLKDLVLQQTGNQTVWDITRQTALSTPYSVSGVEGYAFRTIVSGGDASLGNSITADGRQCTVTFLGPPSYGKTVIAGAFIMERSGTLCDGVPGTLRQITFAGMSGKAGLTVANANKTITIQPGYAATSDTIDLAIDQTKSYLVSFRFDSAPGSGSSPYWYDSRSPTRIHGYLIPADTGREGLAAWSGCGATVYSMVGAVSVFSVFASYPDTSTYTSTIFDTKQDTPAYKQLSWHAAIPGGGLQPTFRVRTGANPDLSDAPAWDSALSITTASPVSLSSLATNRYIQFQVTLKSVAPYTQTVKLQDVMVTWDGPQQAVNIHATLQKGPDKGKFRLLVDDKLCAGATVRAYFKVSKRFMDETMVRTLTVEAEPRN